MSWPGVDPAQGNDGLFFKALYLLTLIPAVYLGMRRGGDFITCSIIVLGNWAAGLFTFSTASPVLANAMSDLLSATFIAILCTNRACLFVGLLLGFASTISIVYGMVILPNIGYHVVYAHILSTVGHAQNLCLLFGALDDGIRARILEVLRGLRGASIHRGFRSSRLDLEDSE